METSDNKVNTGLVSIIIPTYNRSALLQEAIQSCMDQIYRPIECIIVDDGSTDNTNEVVKKFIKKSDENFTVKYVYQQNAGAQVARNTGTDAATGEFIQYLDSDDLLYPDKIANQIEYFKQHPGCDVVFGDWELGTKEKKETTIAYKNGDLIEQFLTNRCIANFAILMRLNLVIKIGKWDEDIKRNQEIDFHLRGVLAGGNFEYQPGLCGFWRVHDGERIVNNSSLGNTLHFFEKWEDILNKKSLMNQDMKKGLCNLYRWLIVTNSAANFNDLIQFYKKLKTLCPSFQVFENGKYAFLSRFIGEENVLWLWHKKQNFIHVGPK